MKILIYTSSANLNPHNGVLLDTAEEYIRAGHEVVFLTCGGGLHACFSNPLRNKVFCNFCNIQHKFLVNKLSKKTKIYSIKNFEKSIDIEFSYNCSADIHQIEYKGIDIGAASMSTYITLTRNLDPQLTPEFKSMMDKFLRSGVILTDAINNAINIIKPDLICLFNGRFFETRPVLQVALQKKIETYVYEVIGNPGEYKRVFFENALPHDIGYNTKSINKFWDNSLLTDDKKREIGADFYIQKKEGKAVGDKAYSAEQKLGVLPEEWDSSFKNILLLNSSEDEFAAVGKEYQEKLFPSQIEGIRYILTENLINKDIKFYLRIHPNLKEITYKYHLELLELVQYENCVVIQAESKISTYTLIDNADQIIVFGSSAGIEASYWGKPVILLGASFYKNLNVAYYPKNKQELQDLLVRDLTPLNSLYAIKYGYFVKGDRGESPNYFDYNRSKFKNISNYQTLLGSVRLYYFLFIFPVSFSLKLQKNFRKRYIPIDER